MSIDWRNWSHSGQRSLAETLTANVTLKETVTLLNNQVKGLEQEVAKRDKEIQRRDALVETNRKLTVDNENLQDKLNRATTGKAHTPLAATTTNHPVTDDPLKEA